MASVKEDQPGTRGGPDGGQARTAVDNARRLLQAGDADAAAAALRPYATRADAPPAELADAAKVLADAGSPVEALGRYLEAGRGFLQAGDIARARLQFASAYELDGKNMDALFELGRADVADGKKHDALDKFVEVLRKSNLKHLPALYEAGCLYELDGQHNQAILAFKRVVERDKAHVTAFEHLGSLHQVRNQLPEAVANYVRAAEVAQARLQHSEAKRLAEAAIAIDGANASAQRVAAEAENAMATASKPASAAPAPPPPEPVARPAAPQTSAVSEVTPVMPPSAEGYAPPPPPPPAPSHMNLGMPSDLEMLEQQSHAMAQLAQVQSAVAQTYRQRMALDEEIKKAQAALEQLHRQQQTVDEDLSGKREELAKVVAKRDAEEAALAEYGDAIAKVKGELEALSSLPTTIADVKAKCAATVDLVAKTNADVEGVAGQSKDVGAKTGAIDSIVKELQAKLSAARQAADALERQLSEVQSGAYNVHGLAEAAAAMVERAKGAIEGLIARNSAIDAAAGELGVLAKAVEAKRAEADSAVKRLDALRAQRKSQFEEIVFNLTPLVGTADEPSAAAQPAQPSAAPTPAAQPPPAQAAAPRATAPQAPAGRASTTAPSSVDALIAAGKFAEAAQRAQTDANGQPKPAQFLLDVGAKLRAAGKLEDAAKLFASARDRDQSSVRARYELGSAYVDLDRPDEAMPLLQTVENDPEFSVLALVAIGKCLRQKGDPEAAEARFSKALEIEGRPDDDYHHALYQLADLRESKGDAESLGLALWSYEELQTGNPNYGDVAQRVAKLKAQLADAGSRSEPAHNGAIKQ